MRIAVDIDEVLAEGLLSYLHYFNTTHGTHFTKQDFGPSKPFWETLGVATQDIPAVEMHYRSHELSRDWLLVNGAQDAIRSLAKQHELFIVSNRQSAGHEATRVWLQKNFPGAFQVIYFTEMERVGDIRPTKAEICLRHGITMLIEDEVKEITACAAAGITVVMFDTPLNRDIVGDGLYRVHSWPEACMVIQEFAKK